jgi:hypothetical protein
VTLGELLDALYKLHDQDGVPMDTPITLRCRDRTEDVDMVMRATTVEGSTERSHRIYIYGAN